MRRFFNAHLSCAKGDDNLIDSTIESTNGSKYTRKDTTSEECYVTGIGLTGAFTDEETSFNIETIYVDLFYLQVTLKDIDGNEVPLKIECSSSEETSIHKVKYRPKTNGSHQLEVLWRGRHVIGSPFTITVTGKNI